MFTRNMRFLYVFNFLKNFQFFGGVALAFYLDWGKLDYTRIFFLEMVFVFAVFFLEIPTGTVADRFGRKKSLAFGGFVSAASFILFGSTASYSVFMVANVLCAVGLTLFSGADKALLYDTLLEYGKSGEGRHYISRYEAFGTGGMLLGFPAGSLFCGSGLAAYPRSTALCFIISGIVFLASGILALFLHEPVRAEKVKDPLREGIEGLRFVFAAAKLRGYVVNFSAVGAASFFIFWFYQSLTREAGLPVSVNGFVAAGFNLTGMLLLWNVKRIEKRFSLDATLMVTALVPGVCFLFIAPFTTNAWVTLPLVFMLTGSKLLRGPLLSDLMNREIGSRNRATVLSGVSMLQRGFIGVLYLPVGYLADKSLPLTFIILGIVAVAVALASRLPRSTVCLAEENK